MIDITDDAQATVHRESSEAVSALLASQKAESTALSPYLPLNPSPVSSPPVPASPSPSEGGRRTDTETPVQQQQQQQQEVMGGTAPTRSSGNKTEFAPSEVIRWVQTSSVQATSLLSKSHVLHDKYISNFSLAFASVCAGGSQFVVLAKVIKLYVFYVLLPDLSHQ